MKFSQKLFFDFPPEVVQKYMADEKALNYLKDKHPDLKDVQLLVDKTDGDTRTIELKYFTEANLPGPLKKVLGGATTQGMTMKFVINTKNHSGTMEAIPDQMPDKIKVTGRVSLAKEGDKWAQKVDGEATVKIFGIGKMAEKFLVEKIQDSSQHETRIRNEFIHSLGDKA